MILVRDEVLECAGRRYRCALGRGGIATKKREGDGITPAGTWPLRRLLYRPDRLAAPAAAWQPSRSAPKTAGATLPTMGPTIAR